MPAGTLSTVSSPASARQPTSKHTRPRFLVDRSCGLPSLHPEANVRQDLAPGVWFGPEGDVRAPALQAIVLLPVDLRGLDTDRPWWPRQSTAQSLHDWAASLVSYVAWELASWHWCLMQPGGGEVLTEVLLGVRSSSTPIARGLREHGSIFPGATVGLTGRQKVSILSKSCSRS